MFRILVAEPIAEEGLARLVNSAQVDVNPTIKRPELLAIIADYDALIVRSATKVDAELLAEVYLELLGGRQASLDKLMGANAVADKEEAVLGFSGHTDLPPRSFPPTSDEFAAHKAAIEKLKNPIWAAVS